MKTFSFFFCFQPRRMRMETAPSSSTALIHATLSFHEHINWIMAWKKRAESSFESLQNCHVHSRSQLHAKLYVCSPTPGESPPPLQHNSCWWVYEKKAKKRKMNTQHKRVRAALVENGNSNTSNFCFSFAAALWELNRTVEKHLKAISEKCFSWLLDITRHIAVL